MFYTVSQRWVVLGRQITNNLNPGGGLNYLYQDTICTPFYQENFAPAPRGSGNTVNRYALLFTCLFKF